MKDYSLIVEGKRISVSEKVYREYYKHYEHERYSAKISNKKNLSFNALKEQGYPIENKMLDKPINLSEEVITQMMIERMLECIGELDSFEKMIIKELYFNGKSQRELARRLDIPRRTLRTNRDKILDKLKKLMEK